MVLLVREVGSDRLFVKKILHGHHAAYEELKSYSHPYLPKIFEAITKGESTIIVEEYIEGQSLGSGELSEKQLHSAIKELCFVLEFLHGNGIIHRDIKPSNIILANDGHIRLIDFDAARMPKDDLEQDTRLLGTRGYAPPEQYGFAQTDERADIYSFGVTLGQLIGKKAQKTPYRRIIRKCTNLNPDKRFQSVKEIRNSLLFYRCRFVFFSITIVITLLSYGLLHKLPLLQTSYPEEFLLFYAKNGQYIIQGSDHSSSGKSVSMRVDMTGKGDFVDFIVPESLNDWVEYGMRYDLSLKLGHSADRIQASFWRDGKEVSLWPMAMENTLREIADDSFILTEVKPLTQITCVDADGDGVKELFVSKGNREHTLLTTVWKLSDIKQKCFEYVGAMWGTSVMYLYENGDIRAIVGDTRLNHYNYSDGVLSVVSDVDFKEFKSIQAESRSEGVQEPHLEQEGYDGFLDSLIRDYNNSRERYEEYFP